jgi:hypothetical protein
MKCMGILPLMSCNKTIYINNISMKIWAFLENFTENLEDLENLPA